VTNSETIRTNEYRWAVSLGVVVLSIGITLLFAELTFRWLLFSEASFMSPLRRPEFYANEWDGDYFKLRHFISQKYQEPSDKTLGWITPLIVASKTYTHIDDLKTENRIPVLLYGDSFAQCHAPKGQCIHDILNGDTNFNGSHYLLNYGVSGYGVDQVYLLYKNTIDNYQSPIVIIGILNYDLDRNVTPVTWGLKPFCKVEEDRLECHTSHLTSKVDNFFFHNPPTIVSYLWRLFVHAGPLPGSVAAWFKSKEERTTEIKSISEAILLEMSEDLNRRNIPHVFLIFEWPKRMIKPPDWRVQFLTDFLQSNYIDFIMAREAIVNREQGGMFNWEKYAVDDGHPNGSYNRLVTEQVLRWLAGFRRLPTGM
jgi:hypothetical protein